MTAFTRELDDLQWYPCRKPGISTALRNMDAKTVKAGNGAAGSTHTVAGLPITIAGAQGMVCAGLWSFDGEVRTGAGSHVRHDGLNVADYITLRTGTHSGTSRTLRFKPVYNAPLQWLDSFPSINNSAFAVLREPGSRILLPFDPHDGSTITSVTLTYNLGTTGRATLPSVPKFRVIRVGKDGVAQALHTPRNGNYLDDGYRYVPPDTSSIAAYENAGAAQASNSYVPDQYSVVDRSLYAYFVDFVEESGTGSFSPDISNAPSTNIRVINVTCAQISTMRPQ
jgi:hypothetical protein